MNTSNSGLNRADVMPTLKGGTMLVLLALAFTALAEEANAQCPSPSAVLAPGQTALCAPAAPCAPSCASDAVVRGLKGRISGLEAAVKRLKAADAESGEKYDGLLLRLTQLSDRLDLALGENAKEHLSFAKASDVAKKLADLDKKLEEEYEAIKKRLAKVEKATQRATRNGVEGAIGTDFVDGVSVEAGLVQKLHDPNESGVNVVEKARFDSDRIGVQGCDSEVTTQTIEALVGLQGEIVLIRGLLSLVIEGYAGAGFETRGSSPDVYGGTTATPVVGGKAGVIFKAGPVGIGAFFDAQGTRTPERAGGEPDWNATLRGQIGVRGSFFRQPQRGGRTGKRERK
ncbi:MAG: hypothetical protein US89_C0003G0027 [Candidatus Peregrinibacteria bacterium GW2011_GWF2_38_29]|nr:MAG: hypothetical protein US89_C0003G0027 [Candidatus Peregrinibacteria bacterium GW2011_GWF2_38_29]HBB02909.1 hypothetical protein [Candidatus Peregrinibacteria bacterium]